MVTGLLLVLAAPPAPVGRQLVDFIAQLIANHCIPRQELIAACESLVFMPQFSAYQARGTRISQTLDFRYPLFTFSMRNIEQGIQAEGDG